MDKFVIFADSTCDLGKDLRDKYDIDYVAMNYILDEKEYRASLDWESHSPKEFYNFMREGNRIRTTQVPAAEYETKFKKALEDGNDILYISCSSALSGSINIAKTVAGKLKSEYNERKIICIDSLISSLGQGYLAIKASLLRSQGKSIDEVADYIVKNRLKVNQIGYVSTLSYLKRAGRVTASSAFFGNLFGVKPILISDKIGQNYAVKKVKGVKNVRHEAALMIKETAVDPENQTLYISHADDIEEAQKLRDEIMSMVKFKNCYINYITTIVGASVGPGCVAAYIVGKEVTVEGRE